MDSSVSPKYEIWFLRVCHHISNAVNEVGGEFSKNGISEFTQNVREVEGT